MEEGNSTLNLGDIIPWVGVPDGIKGESKLSRAFFVLCFLIGDAMRLSWRASNLKHIDTYKSQTTRKGAPGETAHIRQRSDRKSRLPSPQGSNEKLPTLRYYQMASEKTKKANDFISYQNNFLPLCIRRVKGTIQCYSRDTDTYYILYHDLKCFQIFIQNDW